MKIHDSALKHGILPEDTIQAATWSLWVEDLDDESPARQLRLGFDTQGRLLEDLTRFFEGTPLTPSRTHLLWELQRLGPSTQRALAVALHVSPRNITGLVDALEASGYVARSKHPTDRRATIVSLTELGERTMAKMAEDHRMLSHDLVSDLEPADLDRLERNLDAVISRLTSLMAADQAVPELEEL